MEIKGGRKKNTVRTLTSFLFSNLFLILCQNLECAVESKRLMMFHFDKIEASGALTLFIEPGKRNRQVEVFADASVIDSLSAQVENRTLFLDANNSFTLKRRIPLIQINAQRTFPIEVIVSTEELKEIRLLENSRARLQNLSGKALKIFHSSTGSLHLANSKYDKLDIWHEGQGDIVLKGRDVLEMDAKISGRGSLRGEELFLDKAHIYHRGSGQVLIAPRDWLDAQILSTGNLQLLEKPAGKVIKNEGKGGQLIEEY